MPFYDTDADKALFDTLRDHTDQSLVEVIEMDTDINSVLFATRAAKKLIDLIEKGKGNR
jgi:uncharacterized protein (UPF0261 family)